MAANEGPHLLAHLVAPIGQCHAGVVACECIAEPRRTPI
jgi:hypothetical protein